jgi:hypothetical protein
VSIFAFEEGFGRPGFIANDAVDQGYLFTISSLDLTVLDRDNFDIDVVAASGKFYILYFNEFWLGKSYSLRHIC